MLFNWIQFWLLIIALSCDFQHQGWWLVVIIEDEIRDESGDSQ